MCNICIILVFFFSYYFASWLVFFSIYTLFSLLIHVYSQALAFIKLSKYVNFFIQFLNLIYIFIYKLDISNLKLNKKIYLCAHWSNKYVFSSYSSSVCAVVTDYFNSSLMAIWLLFWLKVVLLLNTKNHYYF